MHAAVFAEPARNVDVFFLHPESVVADFGAGSGAYTFALAEKLEGQGRVYAIDVQADLLRRIRNEAHRRGLQNIQTIWGDVARSRGTKLPAGKVDAVLISNVLFQLEKPETALREARRILKSAGDLVVIDWLDSFRSLGPAEKHVYKKEKAIATSERANFKLVDEFSAGAHHYGLMFQAL